MQRGSSGPTFVGHMIGKDEGTPEQQALLARRRAGFDEYVKEATPVLTDFVKALGAENPALVVEKPSAYLPLIDAWLSEQALVHPPSEADKTWLIVRLGYFIGGVLVEQNGGQWFVDESPRSRWFARYVVGKFVNAPKARVDPNHAAAQFVAAGGQPHLISFIEQMGLALQPRSTGG